MASNTNGESKDARNFHTNWVFTYCYSDLTPNSNGVIDICQPDRDSVVRFIEALSLETKYVVAGFEVAPTTGQKHAQGYCQLKARKRLSQLKKIPDGGTVHWEAARGDEIQNRTYCLKDCKDDFIEIGEIQVVNPGVREHERWSLARKSAVAGDLDSIPDQIFVQHYSSIRNIARDNLRPLPEASDTTGLWIYGLTGAGKSRYARTEYGKDPNNLFLKAINKWWDGYKSQSNVLLEDFGKEHSVLGYHLKIWADRYPFPAEIKGSTIQIRPSVLIVTSQYHPRDIWGADPETLAAIERRFRLQFIGDAENNPWLPVLNLPPPILQKSSKVQLITAEDQDADCVDLST